MSKIADQNVSQAFTYLLNKLCIDQFPCGEGLWRSGDKWRCDSPDLLNPLKEPDANLESIHSLIQTSQLQPFVNTAEWSEDVATLRKMAVEYPEKVNSKNILKHFTTLRLSSMNITNVDEGLLKFKNLKELSLTANGIEQINPKNLPKQLEVLEVYGNKLSDIKTFTSALPSLLHLGIGLNSLTSIVGSIQPTNWTSIMSLDLSCNGLTMLKPTLETLKILPKLNNLLLQGNPLCFSIGYRGLVIDTLKQLSILDDVRINADEKHRYKGTSRLKDFPADDAIIDVNINNLKGVRAPQVVENENGEEFPSTVYRYQVVFSFPSKSLPLRKKKTIYSPKDQEKESESVHEGDDRTSGIDSDEDSTSIEITDVNQESCLRQRKTKEQTWCEESIELNYDAAFVITDMTDLKKFLSNGVCLKLLESKVILSPDPIDDSTSFEAEGDLDKSSRSAKPKQAAKDKPKQMPPAKLGGKDGKARIKKKSKGEDMDLFELSRESKVIAEKCLSLEEFISGSKSVKIQAVLKLTDVNNEVEKEIPNEESKEMKLSNTKLGDTKKKGKEHGKTSSVSMAIPQRNKSAMSIKAGRPEKAAKMKESKNLIEISETEDFELHPNITIDLNLDLRSWNTAKEAQDWINENMT